MTKSEFTIWLIYLLWSLQYPRESPAISWNQQLSEEEPTTRSRQTVRLRFGMKQKLFARCSGWKLWNRSMPNLRWRSRRTSSWMIRSRNLSTRACWLLTKQAIRWLTQRQSLSRRDNPRPVNRDRRNQIWLWATEDKLKYLEWTNWKRVGKIEDGVMEFGNDAYVTSGQTHGHALEWLLPEAT